METPTKPPPSATAAPPPAAMPIPGLPDLGEIRRLEAAMKAKSTVAQMGGDPAALDALAMVRSQRVEGVLLFTNPPATYCALQIIKPFFPPAPAPETEADEDLAMDQLVAMSYAFAEPVNAYLLARQGQGPYFRAAFDWAAEHFPGADASLRLGRVAGWCAGILQALDALDPTKPAATLTKPAETQTPPVSPPAPMPDSSPPS